MNSKKTIYLVQLSLLAAISIVLVCFVRIPLIPTAPFLEYDMADIPITIGTLLFGLPAGLITLLIVAIVQSSLFGVNGFIGLIMHFISSGAFICCTSLIYRKKNTLKGAILGASLGVVAMTLLMIPMNYIFTVNFYGIPKQTLDALIWPAIVPFNLLKGVINTVISLVIFKALQPFIKKNKHLFNNTK